MMETIMDKAPHMLFFKSQDEHLCVDSRPCKCHPGMETVGRLINRASKNLRPLHRVLSIDVKVSNIILLKARKDVDEELAFRLPHMGDSLEEEILPGEATFHQDQGPANSPPPRLQMEQSLTTFTPLHVAVTLMLHLLYYWYLYSFYVLLF